MDQRTLHEGKVGNPAGWRDYGIFLSRRPTEIVLTNSNGGIKDYWYIPGNSVFLKPANDHAGYQKVL